jgi:hypothetical protein
VISAATDPLIVQRASAIKLLVSEAAVLRTANGSAALRGGDLGSLLASPGVFNNAVNKTYVRNLLKDVGSSSLTVPGAQTQYLAAAARDNYFLPTTQALPADLLFFKPRLYVSPLNAHLLTALLFLAALAVAVIAVAHHRTRRTVRLAAAPGSLASAAALTGTGELAYLVESHDDDEQLRGILRGRRFFLDPVSGKVRLDTTREEAELDVDTAKTAGAGGSKRKSAMTERRQTMAKARAYDDVANKRLSRLPEELKGFVPPRSGQSA